MHNAAQLFPRRIHDPYSAGSATIDIPFLVDLHAVGDAGLIAAQVGKDVVSVFRKCAIGHYLKGPDVPARESRRCRARSHPARRRDRSAA